MTVQSCVEVNREWDIVVARQTGRKIAKEQGFGDVDQARITTAISELARNIFLYAKSGEIYITVVVNEKGQKGLKVVAEDKGPGIPDVRSAMKDGYSSSGGLGAGLSGVKRLMDNFEIQTKTNEGTVVTAIKWLR